MVRVYNSNYLLYISDPFHSTTCFPFIIITVRPLNMENKRHKMHSRLTRVTYEVPFLGSVSCKRN